MLTIKTRRSTATDGRHFLSLVFERESPDASAPYIEVVYLIQNPDDDPFEEKPPVLLFLSATRTDTREAVQLTEDEIRELIQAAANKLRQ